MSIAALAPFRFEHGQFGGAERILELLTRIEAPVDVFTPTPGASETIKLANLTIHAKQMPMELLQDKHYDTALAKHTKAMFDLDGYDLVILEHPWQVDSAEGHRFIYDAHNNETNIKSQLFPDEVKATRDLESRALKAEHVTFCSLTDNIETDSPKTHIPNGTHLPNISRTNGSQIRNLLFVGSGHPPNIAAAAMLANLAPALPDYTIVIAGACSEYIQNAPSNVRLVGHVNPAILDFLFSNAHAFINLMTAGSGTSLKVGRALSYGVPVISSQLGARGYEGACLIAQNAQEVLDNLAMLANAKNYKEQADLARTTAEGLTWDKIGNQFNQVIQGVLNGNG